MMRAKQVQDLIRKVGFVHVYTGTDSTSQGWFDDYDGKWVYLTLDSFRTIGNANSGAVIAASWTATLFTHLWTQYSQTRCPVLTSAGGASTRGATAADYAANKRLTLPDERGRVLAGAGQGSSLTARTQHTQVGEETHAQTTAEMPAHNHLTYYQTTGTGGITANQQTGTGIGSTIPTSTTGSGNGFNVVQPTTFEHFVISAGAR
jgi:hypothetical protein